MRLKLNSAGGKLVVVTVLSQVVSVAFSPILTRLFNSEQYGVLVLFNSITSFIAIFASLKYDNAVLAAKDRDEAGRISLVGVFFTVLMSVIVLVTTAALFFTGYIESLFLLSAIAILLLSCLRIYECYYTRIQQFNLISFEIVLPIVLSVFFQLIFHQFYNGLVYGRVIGLLLATVILMVMVRKSVNFPLSSSFNEVFKTAKEYINFPKYNAPQAIINRGAQEIPVWLIPIALGSTILGFYGLADRVLMMPLNVVASTLSKPMLPKIVESRSYSFTMDQLWRFGRTALLLFLPVALVIIFFGNTLFSTVFGNEWETVGTIAKALLLMYFFRYIGAPISILGILLGYQKKMLVLSVLRFILPFAAILPSVYIFELGPLETIWIYSGTMAIYWVIVILSIYFIIRSHYSRD